MDEKEGRGGCWAGSAEPERVAWGGGVGDGGGRGDDRRLRRKAGMHTRA